MRDLVIGCPVRRREWILPRWIEAVQNACDIAGVSPEYVFVVAEGDPSIEALRTIDRQYPTDIIFTQETLTEDRRRWDGDRYHQMVELRNMLLHRVRQIGPRVFYSLDTDILISPESLKMSLELIDGTNVVGQRTFMTPPPDVNHTSRAQLVNGVLVNRGDLPGFVGEVDCVMAAKLMSPPAYMVDYRWHAMGEDIGICEAWNETGIKRIFDGRVALKHVMGPAWLEPIDTRVGF